MKVFPQSGVSAWDCIWQKSCLLFHAALCVFLASAAGAEMTREEVVQRVMKPYAGPSAGGVDTSTLSGKVMCGYQGWFACPDDGSERGWFHWAGRGGAFEPGVCSIDFWPDVRELDEDEKCPTPFRHADGSVAHVYSAMNPRTVARHFEWMRDYGIDGAFVQRFSQETVPALNLNFCTTVLANCRAAANQAGRAYAVMYDLSGLGENQMDRVMTDWRLLVDHMRITEDPAYLHHDGKPVVAVWGIGFNDNRAYTLGECATLLDFLKDDPEYGGCTVMVGVPSYWRTLRRDAVDDPRLHEVLLKADIISPWAVGRFRNSAGAQRYAEEVWRPDIAWCRERGKAYLPVVFPGFSWHNLKPESPPDQIPRRKGEFLWAQYEAAVEAGATMIYQAMFDEVDEGTAIFKCTNDPPVGESRFLTYEGLPTDHYLKLVGAGGRLLRGDTEPCPPPECRSKAAAK